MQVIYGKIKNTSNVKDDGKNDVTDDAKQFDIDRNQNYVEEEREKMDLMNMPELVDDNIQQEIKAHIEIEPEIDS